MNPTKMNTYSLSFLSLVILLSTISSTVALLRAPPKLPLGAAEKLIRELNLFPNLPINIFDDADLRFAGVPEIVERRFKFPDSVDPSGVSEEELGHHAGYYQIEHSHAARMFYLFFKSRNSTTDPVVIWLTGGPGCSSEMALFYENGPYTIANNLSLVRNEYGWDQVSNILFVDQPIGTGFSYSSDRRDIRHNEKGVSDDLYDFVQAFFKEHPDLAENDFYITGESYAGHYIPAFAARVYRGNKEKNGTHINLKGFAIGNGLTDPAIQYGAYADYALDMGILTQPEHDRINKVLPLCETAIKLCGTDGTIFSSIIAHAGDVNIDHRCQDLSWSLNVEVDPPTPTLSPSVAPSLVFFFFPCSSMIFERSVKAVSLCYEFSNLEKYLNQKSVRAALGVGDIEFVPCSTTVYQAMLMDWMRNLEVGIPELLEDGVKLLVYAGEYDLICNWLGNSRWVHAMEWSGQKEFVASSEVPFEVDGCEAGLLTSHGPLSFLKVHDAGHMVPMDQPKASLEMLKRWMSGSLSRNTV